jgi:hypothetical protein
MKIIKNYLDNIFNTKTITKFIGIQNILLTIIFNLTNIEYAKWFHLIKLTAIIPYRNYHYLQKGKPYYLIELCYILMYVNWFYLLCDRILLDTNETYYRNILYNNSYLYSSVILTLASFATKDILTWRKMIAITKSSIHLENGFLFLMLQKNNLDNFIDTEMGFNNLIIALIFYFTWLYTYNKLQYHNLNNENINTQTMVIKVFGGNLTLYNISHCSLCMLALWLGYYSFFNTWVQQFVFGIGYLGMSVFTAINEKY